MAETDSVVEGVVVDRVPEQDDMSNLAPFLRVSEDLYLVCGCLVSHGLMGKKVRVTVEVLDG